MKQQIEIIRSNRKTISIEIKKDLIIVVRCPKRMSECDVASFIRKKSSWIEKNLQKIQSCVTEHETLQFPSYSQEEFDLLRKSAKEIITQRVNYYAPLIGVSFSRITIRKQKTRWGSCSSLKNLNFNWLLVLCPKEVLDYVVVHELCHLLYMNHSKRFWECVERHYPDYRAQCLWLKKSGSLLIHHYK